ncbi:MAG: hypothetical protein CME06_06160 [Gemmatimonadetes bacterium]|nr:hypothetical protein [Gemmatimonadota bacterium]
MHDPFRHLSLSEIGSRKETYRAQDPILWQIAEAIVFIRNPYRWGVGRTSPVFGTSDRRHSDKWAQRGPFRGDGEARQSRGKGRLTRTSSRPRRRC